MIGLYFNLCAGRDLDGFLRIAHSRYLDGLKGRNQQRDDAVGAVRAVQRTQREAARAASVPATAPKKQPTSPATGVDVKKLTQDDVSQLLRMSVEQHR